MNCRNCGAPMSLVHDRDYFVCEYCTSFYIPEPTRDGVRVLHQKSDLRCPVCHEELVVGSIEETRVLYCQKCRGILVRQNDFGAIVKYLRAHSAAEDELHLRPLERTDLEREIHCPHCSQKMNTHPYYGPGNVVIDSCAACGVVWLDYGELHRIINAPGRDRGRALRERFPPL